MILRGTALESGFLKLQALAAAQGTGIAPPRSVFTDEQVLNGATTTPPGLPPEAVNNENNVNSLADEGTFLADVGTGDIKAQAGSAQRVHFQRKIQNNYGNWKMYRIPRGIPNSGLSELMSSEALFGEGAPTTIDALFKYAYIRNNKIDPNRTVPLGTEPGADPNLPREGLASDTVAQAKAIQTKGKQQAYVGAVGRNKRIEKQRKLIRTYAAQKKLILEGQRFNKFVSFATIVEQFILEPLNNANNGEKFKEIQAIYYPLNANAGAAAGINISEFLINASAFRAVYTKLSRMQGTPDFTVEAMMQMLIQHFVDRSDSYMYGFQENFLGRNLAQPLDVADRVAAPATPAGDLKAATAARANVTKQGFPTFLEALKQKTASSTVPKFRMPSVSCLIQAVQGASNSELIALDPGSPPVRPPPPPTKAHLARVVQTRTIIGSELSEGLPNVDEIVANAHKAQQEFNKKLSIWEQKKAKYLAERKPILRLHIYDRAATPYSQEAELLNQLRNTNLINKQVIEENASLANYIAVRKASASEDNKQPQSPTTIPLVTPVGIKLRQKGDGSSGFEAIVTRAGIPMRVIKEFLHQTMPTLEFGRNNSMIMNASVSTLQNGISTIMIQRSSKGHGSPSEPYGIGSEALPLKVIPSKVEMDIIGCPLFSFAQQFFIDFGTQTTLDNIYAIIGINHEFTPGSFKTHLTFTPLDGYGKYESFTQKVNEALRVLNSEIQTPAAAPPSPPATSDDSGVVVPGRVSPPTR